MADKVIWITNYEGTFGIVLTQNSVGEKKAYFGKAAGEDAGSDVKNIKEYGGKITESIAKQIYEHFKEDQN